MNFGDPSSVTDHIQAALEASAGALIGMEWLIAELAHEADDRAVVHWQASQTMASLRRAIEELRLARGESCGTVVLGFVLEAEAK